MHRRLINGGPAIGWYRFGKLQRALNSMKRLYDWMMKMAAHGKAKTALFWVAFIESSVFPIPPDIMLIPMVLANRAQAWKIAATATIGSVLGGMAGYAIGYFLFDAVAQPLLEFYGYLDKFQTFKGQYNDYGAWIVFIAGVTPFPYKVITIASGATALSLPVFIIASIVARAIRFFVVAGLLYAFGEQIRGFIERWFNLLAIAFTVLLIGGFVALKYLF